MNDDRELTAMLIEYLAQEGGDAHAVHNGADGVAAALSGEHAIVVLDVMMPRVRRRPLLDPDGAWHRLPAGRGLTMGRLFWKLFLSIWLAMLLSFAADVPYLTLSGQPSHQERVKAGVRLKTTETLLTTSGADAAVAFLTGRAGDPSPPRVALLGGRGQLLAGEESAGTGTRRTVVAADGRSYTLVSEAADIDGPEPEGFLAVPIVSGAVVSFLFSLGLAWYLSRPLHHLRWALHAVARGEFSTRALLRMGTRRHEIVDLGRDFDSMADRLQRLVEARQRLLHDISHELRSPLTRLQAAIGLGRQNPTRRRPPSCSNESAARPSGCTPWSANC